MEVRVLGPVELVAEDGPVPLGALKLRRLLSALVVHAGEARSSDVLIDAVWGPSPPASAAKLLQTYVSQLRKALPTPARIRTLGAGYALELEDESLDAARFERLLSEGRAASREGNAALAVSFLRRGLRLWRGQAYGDFAYEEFARAEAERLEELRSVALEERIEAELALGRHDDLLPELRSLAAEQPLRERLQAQAMLALYRCGRQSEALDLYTDARARLRDELGLEPSAELRELQRKILQQDAELAVAAVAEAAASALPAPPNRLLGRGRELAELRELLRRRDEMRLLVLTGAGGSGKTRLALEAARESAESFANGAAFINLAPLRDPALVVGAIARALGLPDVSDEDSLQTLADALGPRELLLLVDNAEHVRAAAPNFVELLARAPHLTLLVTSRVVLHISGEQVYPVEPLAVRAAVALFLERAREAEPRFQPDTAAEQAIQRICERLDGLPLAIELAASRVRALSPVELLDRLDPRLPLLTGGPRDLPARQQTLRATLEWSIELLDREEQRALTRLAVFAGGCTLEAAEAVCGTTVERLGSLVDHNLLRRTATADGSRYAMLETVREFALESLETDGAELRSRHAQYFAALSERAEGAHGTLDRARESWVEAELDNFRAALAWTVEAPEPELASRLLAGAAGELFFRGHVAEGRRWAARVLPLLGRVPRRLEADVLARASDLAKEGGDTAAAARLIEESANAYREVGDLGPLAWALANLAEWQGILGDVARARGHFEQSLRLSRELGLEVDIGHALHGLGELERDAGNFDRAAELLEESLSISQRIDDPRMASATTHGLGDLALERADLETASGRYAEALVRYFEAEEPRSLAYTLGGLAAVAALRGEVNRAGRLWSALERIEEERAAEIGRSERERYEARLRTLDPAELARAVADGRELPLEVVIDEALSGR